MALWQCFVPFQGQVIFHTGGPPLCSRVAGPSSHVCFGAAGEPSTCVCGQGEFHFSQVHVQEWHCWVRWSL